MNRIDSSKERNGEFDGSKFHKTHNKTQTENKMHNTSGLKNFFIGYSPSLKEHPRTMAFATHGNADHDQCVVNNKK